MEYYNDYHDVYDEKPDKEVHAEAHNEDFLHIVLISTFYALSVIAIFSLNISFLVACLKIEKLRTDTGRWTQQLVVWAILVVELLGILTANTNINKLAGMCQIMLPLRSTLQLLIKLGLLFTILERLAGVVKREPDTPGFTKRPASLLIAGAVVGALILTMGLWFGFGGISRYEYRGTYECAGSSRAPFILNILEFVLIVVIFAMAIALIIVLCRARAGNMKPYPVGRVVPVIVGTLVIDTFFAIDIGIRESMSFFYTSWILGVIIMMLVWLFGDQEVREAYQDACCPCCPRKKAHEEHATLLP